MNYLKKTMVFTALLFAVSLTLGACSNNKKDSEAKTSETEEVKKDEAKTTELFAKGSYKVGEDINPGSYYLVLTNLKYSADDAEKSAYVTVETYNSSDKYQNSQTLSTINKPVKVSLKKDETLKLDDNYHPVSWTVTFFTTDDYNKSKESSNDSSDK